MIPPRSYAAQRRQLPPRRPEVSARAPIGTGSGTIWYDALNHSKARSYIHGALPSGGDSSQGQSYTRTQIAILARHLFENNPLCSYAVNTISRFSTPLMPSACTPDLKVNGIHEEYWREWCKVCDFTGRFRLDTLQRLGSKAMDLDGDIGFQMTSEGGFPQLVGIEGWRIETPVGDRSERIVDGVIVDAKGRVKGYSVALGGGDYEQVPASEMLLLFDPRRISNYRGLSPLTRGSNDLRDGTDIKAFLKLGTKLQSSIPWVLESGPVAPSEWGNDEANPPAADASTFEKSLGSVQLAGGEIPIITGGKATAQQQTSPGQNAVDFTDLLAGHFVAGLGLPPAFFLDEKLTGPNQRSVNVKAQRTFDERQDLISGLILWAWPRVIGWGIEHDGLPVAPRWDRCGIQFPAKYTIDAGREASQDREDVMSGLSTRQRSFAGRGDDWQRETDQGFAEADYIFEKARALSAKHGLPVELVLMQWGFTPPKPAAPQPGNKEAS